MGPDIALLVLVALFTVLTIYDIIVVWRVEKKAISWRSLLPRGHPSSGDDHGDDGAADEQSRGVKRKPRGRSVGDELAARLASPGPIAEGKEEELISDEKKPAHSQKLSFRTRTTPFWVFFELIQCGLMAGSIATWIVYATSLYQNSDAFRMRFDIYDADASAPCHYLMSQRVASSNSSSAPGTPGRWMLPGSDAGLNDMAAMLAHSHNLNFLLTLYQLLNGIVILLFFIHLIHLDNN